MYPSAHSEKREGLDGTNESPGPSRGRYPSVQLSTNGRISRQSSATSDSYISKSISVNAYQQPQQHGRQYSGNVERGVGGGGGVGVSNSASLMNPASGGGWPQGMGSNSNSTAMSFNAAVPSTMNPNGGLDRQDSWVASAGGYFQDGNHPGNMHGLHNNINPSACGVPPPPPPPPLPPGGMSNHPYGHSPTVSIGNSVNNIPMHPPSHSYGPPPPLPPQCNTNNNNTNNNSVSLGYSHLGSPTAGGPPAGPYLQPTSVDGNMMLLPSSSSGGGQRYYHQQTASESSSFAMDTLSPSNCPQDAAAEIRRLKQMNFGLQEDLKRSRNEQSMLRDEVSHFRTKCAVAASEKREILSLYHRDVMTLLSVVDAMLTKLEEAFPLLPPSSLPADPTADHYMTNDNNNNNTNATNNPKYSHSNCTGMRGAENNGGHTRAPRIALLSKILERSPLMPSIETEGENEANPSSSKKKKKNDNNKSKPLVVTDSLREIATALNVDMEQKGCGMALLRVKNSGGSRHPPNENDSDQILVEEELREIAVLSHRNLESYLHALNYGFSSGAGVTNPLAIQIPVPVLHSVLSRPVGNTETKQ